MANPQEANSPFTEAELRLFHTDPRMTIQRFLATIKDRNERIGELEGGVRLYKFQYEQLRQGSPNA